MDRPRTPAISQELAESLHLLIDDEIGAATPGAFQRALHSLDDVVHVAGGERIVATLDESKLS